MHNVNEFNYWNLLEINLFAFINKQVIFLLLHHDITYVSGGKVFDIYHSHKKT